MAAHHPEIGVQAGNGPAEVAFDAPPDVRDALDAMGRTEDVRFAPSGRRLAIAGFLSDRIAVADVEITAAPAGLEIAVTSLDQFTSSALREPHGIDFLDDDTLVVGNRAGGIEVFRLPPSGGEGATTMTAADPIQSTAGGLLDAPGSVLVHSLGPGRHELLACNNWENKVTRHALDASGALSGGEVVLRKWLDIPDGLALSHDERWLAVSNHNSHGVLLYAFSGLDVDADPIGVLRGAHFPHGVRFGAGDRCIVVADSGAPHVHVFLPSGSDWEGVRYPAATVTVMDEATFARGRHNHEEGGPKGIDVDPRTNVLAVTAECLPLAFYDLDAVIDGGERGGAGDPVVRYELDVLAQAESTRAAAAAQLSTLLAESERVHAEAAAQASALTAEIERITAESEHHRATAAQANAQLEEVLHSTSWRLTEPARRAFAAARRLKQR